MTMVRAQPLPAETEQALREAGARSLEAQLVRLRNQGATLVQAMRATRLTEPVLSDWARARGHVWSRRESPEVQDYTPAHAEGMTAAEAVARFGGRLLDAQDWARQKGVQWPETSIIDATPIAQRPPYDDSAPDPDACRKLWQSVLIDQMKQLNGINATGTSKRSPGPKGALGWFWSRDAALVAMFAGYDAEAMRSGVRALAVKLQLMQPGQDRP